MAASDSIHEETGETSATTGARRSDGTDRSRQEKPHRKDKARGGEEPARLTIWVRGEVQGVGFRWFTRAAALRIGGLVGFALNLDDGRVQIVGEGARAHCELLEWLRGGDTPGHVEGVTEIWDEPRGGYRGFAIR